MSAARDEHPPHASKGPARQAGPTPGNDKPQGAIMFRCPLILFCASLFASFVQAGPEKEAKLEGAWVGTSWKRGDGEVAKDKVNTELVLGKGTYEFPTGINKISKKGTIKVDAAKKTI